MKKQLLLFSGQRRPNVGVDVEARGDGDGGLGGRGEPDELGGGGLGRGGQVGLREVVRRKGGREIAVRVSGLIRKRGQLWMIRMRMRMRIRIRICLLIDII